MGMTIKPPGKGPGGTVQPPQTGGTATVGQPGNQAASTVGAAGNAQLTVRNTVADGPTVTGPKNVVADPQLTPGGRGTATIEGGAAAPGGNAIPGQTEWGQIGGDINAQSDLQLLFATKLEATTWNTQVPPQQIPINQALAAEDADLQQQIDDLEALIPGIGTGKVAKAGDTMSGALRPQGPSSQIIIEPQLADWAILDLRKASSGFGSAVKGMTGTSLRWQLNLGDTAAEGGANAGSNFTLQRFNDAGVLIDTVFTILRTTGVATFSAGVNVGGSVTLTGAPAQLNISPAVSNDAQVNLNKNSSGRTNVIVGTGDGFNRWAEHLGNATAESGTNAGSDYSLIRYADAGTAIGSAVSYVRKNGYQLLGRGAVRAAALTDADSGNANVELNAVASGTGNYLTANMAGVLRWQVALGDGTAESGSNAGSNLVIRRYSDAGAQLTGLWQFNRDTGKTLFPGQVQVDTVAGLDTNLMLNKTSSGSIAQVIGGRLGAVRWTMRLGNEDAETGSGNAGSNFALLRYNDAGGFIDTSISINRATGSLNFRGAAFGYQGTVTDPSPRVYLSKVSGTNVCELISQTNGVLRWNMQLSNGSAEPGSNLGSDFMLHRYADNGTYLGSTITVYRASGGVVIAGASSGDTLTVNGNTGFNGSGYFTGNSNANQLIARNVIYCEPGNGYQFSPGYAQSGSYFYCTISYGNPNYGNYTFRWAHSLGSYTGFDLSSPDGKTLRWSGQSGTLNADAFTPWSDRRLKTNIAEIVDARSIIAGLKGYTYTMLQSTDYDGSNTKRGGLLAQEALAVLPVAVSLVPMEILPEGVEPLPPSPDDPTPGMRYTLDYNPVIGALVNDNNGLAARIQALETALAAALERITQLEAP